MYTPSHFAAGTDAVRNLLARPAAANLITMTPRGLLATLLPFTFDPSVGDLGALHGHLARNNTQWSEPVTGEALVIVQGADAYISPSWYASKAEHGRVVPTWNYSTAHVYGRLVVHDDPAWLAGQVRGLTELHEAQFEHPWAVDDAPERFVAGQLRAIVGIQVEVEKVEAKRKLSQNRSEADRTGVVAGLRSERAESPRGEAQVADRMAEDLGLA